MPQENATPPLQPRRTVLGFVEAAIEALLFAGRWLMAPIYIGLLVILGAIAVKFIEEMVVTIPQVLSMEERDLVMFVLSLVDLALLGNLVLMVTLGMSRAVLKLALRALLVGEAMQRWRSRQVWGQRVWPGARPMRLAAPAVACGL